MNCELIYSLLIGIGSGILSSLLFWVLINIVFTPRITSDDQIQSKKTQEYIRVFNKSHFNVYSIVCRIEYIYSDGHKFFRTDQTIPYLNKRGGWYRVILNGSKETNAFFKEGTGKMRVVITYQNRFGIKTNTKPIYLKCDLR